MFGLESLNDLPELPEFADTEDGQVSFSDMDGEAENITETTEEPVEMENNE